MTSPTLLFDILPTNGPTTGRFGPNEPGYVGGHGGHDFGIPIGSPVAAPAQGLVLGVIPDSAGQQFGTWVLLQHPGMVPEYSAYAHLNQALVNIGQEVEIGDLLGRSGNTGKSTGPHLHWACGSNPNFPKNFNELVDPYTLWVEENVDVRSRLDRLERLLIGTTNDWELDGLVNAGIVVKAQADQQNVAIKYRMEEHSQDGHGSPINWEVFNP